MGPVPGEGNDVGDGTCVGGGSDRHGESVLDALDLLLSIEPLQDLPAGDRLGNRQGSRDALQDRGRIWT